MKVVTPAARCELVAWAQGAYQLTERRACRATGVARSTVTYRSCRPSQAPLRDRLRELAQAVASATAIGGCTCCGRAPRGRSVGQVGLGVG